jgi:hypothetical protein
MGIIKRHQNVPRHKGGLGSYTKKKPPRLL